MRILPIGHARHFMPGVNRLSSEIIVRRTGGQIAGRFGYNHM
jgi:hypothetical protein